MRDTSVQLTRIHDIFNNEFEEGGINVAVIGNEVHVLLLLKQVYLQRAF